MLLDHQAALDQLDALIAQSDVRINLDFDSLTFLLRQKCPFSGVLAPLNSGM